MPKYFTHYWNNKETWNKNKGLRAKGVLLDHTSGELFKKRGVHTGDVIYVVTNIEGALYLCGRLVVGEICEGTKAARILGRDNLFEATEHIIAAEPYMPMHFDLKVPLELSRRLRFDGSNPRLKFEGNSDRLDRQTLGRVRKLTPESAAELDRLLKVISSPADEQIIPEEVIDAQTYYEGATKQITVNVYERNAKARKECIAHYGLDCFICGFNFKTAYGDVGVGFIHVHHLKPLSEVSKEYNIDPIRDLRPVCPNCHAMIHKKAPPYTVEEMKELLQRTWN